MMNPHPVGMEIGRLSHKFHRALYAYHGDSFPEGITGTNIRIIRYLAEQPDRDIFQKDIEEAFSVRRSTVSKVLALMDDKGLIIRQSVANDARLKKLILTERGMDIYRITTNAAIAAEKRLVAGFSEEEHALLLTFLHRLHENMNECCNHFEGGIETDD